MWDSLTLEVRSHVLGFLGPAEEKAFKCVAFLAALHPIRQDFHMWLPATVTYSYSGQLNPDIKKHAMVLLGDRENCVFPFRELYLLPSWNNSPHYLLGCTYGLKSSIPMEKFTFSF